MRLQDASRVLWIDSLCINQQDDIERGQQVGLMQEIYSGTKLNLVYLGEGGDLARAARESLLLIRRQMEDETEHYVHLATTLYNSRNGMRHSSTTLPDGLSYPALSALYSEAWFSRLWILQEIALAGASKCHWGELEIDLITVLRSAAWIRYKYLETGGCLSELRFGVLKGACLLYQLADPEFGKHNPRRGCHPDLCDIFDYSTYFRASDPRDYVFGMLGVRHVNLEMLCYLLEVDYTKSARRVFIDATRAAVDDNETLDNFRPIGGGDEVHENDEMLYTASWVVPWGCMTNLEQGGIPLNKVYKADNYRMMSYAHSLARPDELVLKGLELDSISYVGTTFAKDILDDPRRTLEILNSCIELLQDHAETGSKVRSVEDLGPAMVVGYDMALRAVERESFQDLLALRAYLRQKAA